MARGKAELAHEIDALLSRCVAPSNFDDLLLRKSDFAVSGASCSTASALLAHIRKIVNLRSKKQVVWPHTRRRVAAVEHAHLVWDRAVMQFPRHAMRVELPAPDNDQSVPVFIGVGLPQPTPIGLVDFRPEPINQGYGDKSSGSRVSLHGWPYVISRTPHGYVNEMGGAMETTGAWSRGSHQGFDSAGFWYQHLYPPDHEQCWCGWKPPITTVTVTAAQYGKMNPDGTWDIQEAQLGQRQGE